MSHWKTYFDNRFLGAHDLPRGRDVVCVIEKVRAEVLTSQRGQTKKPVITLEGKKLEFVVNRTNAKAIAGMYGNDTKAWLGKPIAIYATTTSVAGDSVECVRVRPTVPKRPSDQPADLGGEEQGADDGP